MATFRDATHKRILEMIRSVKTANGQWKVLVVDHEALRILSSACRMYDIMEEGITLVENLDIARQPFPNLEAIYFMAPTSESVQHLIDDFAPGKSKLQYAAVHVFLTSHASDDLIQRIGNSPVADHISTLQELNLEYLCPEAEVFHFDMKNDMQRVFASAGQESEEIRLLAGKLATVVATLGEKPLIRYSSAHPSSKALATALLDQVSTLPVGTDKRSTVLILDRSLDLAIHEFSYQAMCYDLLEIKNDTYKYVYTNNVGDELQKEVLIGETDQLWPVLRHKHIADTIKYVIENFNDFTRTNKAIEMKNKPKEVVELKEMGEVMRTMPQFQELLNKYSLHIHMANQCMKVFKHKDLENLAAVEQDAATGRDPHGSKVKNVLPRADKFLGSPQVGTEEKTRLLLLLALTQKLKEADRRALMTKGGLSPGDENWRAIEAAMKIKGEAKEEDKKKDKKDKKDAEAQYELSRYKTRVRRVLDKLVEGELGTEDFPFLGADAAAGLEAEKQAVSLKKEKEMSGWADKGKKKDHKKEGKAELGQKFGSAIIVFVIGGVSYNEIRAAYEVAKAAQREIVIGGPCVLTPAEYLSTLASCFKQ